MLCVSDLYIYPVKSGAGIRVPSATLDPIGIVGDRRWMVVDRDHRFLSQREIPRLALLRAELIDGGIRLEAPGVEACDVATPPLDHARVSVTVWDDTFDALPVQDDADTWASHFLGVQSRLIYCPPDVQRPVDPEYALNQEQVSFADGFPLLVAGQASLDDVNRRLEARGVAPVPMNRFRPNLVIAGSEPFAEDTWRRIRIGRGAAAVEIDIVKPCARCSTVPVDQATGIRGKEPLTTLASYRQRNGKVYFGQNAIHTASGVLQVGDQVEIVATH